MKKTANRSTKGHEDIIKLILEDHKPLKKLIKMLKDSEADATERREAFDAFAPLLLNHAKPEEQILYTIMKDEKGLRTEGLEGDVEHALASQMIAQINEATDDEDLWSAQVKILGELVEHHIKEEEEELLPDFRKKSEPEERKLMGKQYLEAQQEMADDVPSRRKAKRSAEYHAH